MFPRAPLWLSTGLYRSTSGYHVASHSCVSQVELSMHANKVINCKSIHAVSWANLSIFFIHALLLSHPYFLRSFFSLFFSSFPALRFNFSFSRLMRGAFNKFQDCSSQQANSNSWKPILLWSCTATIVHHFPWSHFWRHAVTSLLLRYKWWALMFDKCRVS